MRAAPSAIPQDLDFLNLANRFEVHVLHCLGRRREFLSPKRPARNHEHHVIGHQPEHGLEIAAPGGFNPGGDKAANRTFVFGHGFLPMGKHSLPLRVSAAHARTPAIGDSFHARHQSDP
jgi:hypothetical protein